MVGKGEEEDSIRSGKVKGTVVVCKYPRRLNPVVAVRLILMKS